MRRCWTPPTNLRATRVLAPRPATGPASCLPDSATDVGPSREDAEVPVHRLTTTDQVEVLVRQLFGAERTEPVVAVTSGSRETEPFIDVDGLAAQVEPVPVFVLPTGPLTSALTSPLPDDLGVYGPVAVTRLPGPPPGAVAERPCRPRCRPPADRMGAPTRPNTRDRAGSPWRVESPTPRIRQCPARRSRPRRQP